MVGESSAAHKWLPHYRDIDSVLDVLNLTCLKKVIHLLPHLVQSFRNDL